MRLSEGWWTCVRWEAAVCRLGGGVSCSQHPVTRERDSTGKSEAGQAVEKTLVPIAAGGACLPGRVRLADLTR